MVQQTLRKGSKGSSVVKLQKLLNAYHLSVTLEVDGDFGAATHKAVKEFQKSSGLISDGIVGAKTWQVLSLGHPSITKTKKSSHLVKTHGGLGRYFSPQHLLADIASKYIGVKESGDNKAGKSKELLAIFEADDLATAGVTDGYPWCAAFVSFCVQKLLTNSPAFSGVVPPREASVSRFLNIWASNNKCLVFPKDSTLFSPAKGDIVVFNFSHIGIVEEINGKMVTTIEGNTVVVK